MVNIIKSTASELESILHDHALYPQLRLPLVQAERLLRLHQKLVNMEKDKD